LACKESPISGTTITAEDCTGPVYLPPPKQRATLMRDVARNVGLTAHIHIWVGWNLTSEASNKTAV